MTTATPLPRIPVLRKGQPYESLDRNDLSAVGMEEPLGQIGQANTGMIRRDLLDLSNARDRLRDIPMSGLFDIFHKAGRIFLEEEVPISEEGPPQSRGDYIETLSATSGLPHKLVRQNMEKIHHVFTHIEEIIKGLTRGLDPAVLDRGFGEQAGVAVGYYPTTDCLGVILPSNSPGVNSIWLPAVALKVPVILKPGSEEPWTPLRIIQSLIMAGCPAEAFCFYPTDHEGAATILQSCGRAILFGDENTIHQYAGNPNVQVHGPGWSKVILGADEAEHWKDHLEVMVESILANGGRSCINASAIVTASHGEEIAEALGDILARIEAKPPEDKEACLAAFANAGFADYIDSEIEEGLKTEGADDVTARFRTGPRKVEVEGRTYLHPTIIHCANLDHPLANREFLFPYASVVEVPQEDMLDRIGPTLVASAITKDEAFKQELLRSRLIQRLNLGPIPTSSIRWDQPHEGNLFEFLYQRRAIQHSN